MLCILRKAVHELSLSRKQDNKEDFNNLVLINSCFFSVPRNLTKSTATSNGRDSEAHSENKQNTCCKTSSLAEVLVTAILMAVVVVLEYAMFWFARNSSVVSRSPRQSVSM